MEHAYTYDPHGIQAFLKLFVLAYNPFQLFVTRNLQAPLQKRMTLKGGMRQVYKGLVCAAEPLLPHEAVT